MADPWQFWESERLASVTECPLANVSEHWPRLCSQMEHCRITDRASYVAMAGTIAIESASSFRPVKEAFYLGEPAAENHRKKLTYAPFWGRGFIQLTHRSNYAKYGPKVAELWGAGNDPTFDLVANPDNALDPDVSAACAALYWRDHGGDGQYLIPKAAARGDWAEVRRLVWGANPLDFPIGHHGRDAYERLVRIADALGTDPETRPIDGYVFPVEGYSGAVNLHWGTFAGGSDLFAPRGTAVRAIHAGTVVYRSEWGAIGGNAVQIEHDGDGLESYYAHGDRVPAVQMGQKVAAGAFLFGVGDSGNATQAGPHLHFGMGTDILTGSGPSGGCGANFDAVDFLRRLLAVGGPVIAPPSRQDFNNLLMEHDAQRQRIEALRDRLPA